MSGYRPDMRSLTLIWAALCGGVLGYTGIAWGLIEAGATPETSLPPSVMNFAGPVVLAWMLASLFARRWLVSRLPDEAAPEIRFQRYQTAVIVGLALIEGPGLLMVTLGLITSSSSWVLAGGGAALVLMLMAKPTEAEFGGL